eukprot:TRINITY_DN56505_c0_g1_i1.p1 TRINITY_DN56505_c0_g1~~TRINITY_DN56505_c0_g1_i1.p1  ORF type:complete len:462 (+),score=36.46 TRINITY_DN56505_c0_g1_i1:130-1386(+)
MKDTALKPCRSFVPTSGLASAVAAFFGALAPAARAEGGSSSAAVASEVSHKKIGSIPLWKVDLTFNPDRMITPQQPSRDMVNSAVHGTAVHLPWALGMSKPDNLAGESSERITSTIRQDSQRCAVVDLPLDIISKPSQFASTMQTGHWRSVADVQYGVWKQDYMSSSWQTVYVGDNIGKLGAKVEPITPGDLLTRYDWKETPQNSPSLAVHTQLERAVNDEPIHTYQTYAIIDCEGTLMFVLNLRFVYPKMISVYDKAGRLVAHTAGQWSDDKREFIDPNGYLLATARPLTPTVRQPRPFSSTERSPIDPYRMTFEQGGFKNASFLLDEDYRWVLVTAMEVYALVDSYNSWEPPTRGVGLGPFVVVGLVACMGFLCYTLFRLAYPRINDDPQFLSLMHRKGSSLSLNYSGFLGIDQNI